MHIYGYIVGFNIIKLARRKQKKKQHLSGMETQMCKKGKPSIDSVVYTESPIGNLRNS